MCETISNNRRIVTAKNDIIAYKVLESNYDPDSLGRLPFYWFVNKSKVIRLNNILTAKKLFEDFSFNFKESVGVHVFKTREQAKGWWYPVRYSRIVRVTIPKGTTYINTESKGCLSCSKIIFNFND